MITFKQINYALSIQKNLHFKKAADECFVSPSTLSSMGIIPTVGPYFLPLILPELKKKFPNLNLKIIEGQSTQLVSKVKDGDLDIAILALPFELKGLLALKFWKENFHLISHKDEVVKKRKK